jgi:4-diphosphocytidyl-2-C-methyl-D-erythritol kinase
MKYEELAPAKINLALHVRRRRDDGYHDLETLFAFACHGDVLSAKAADLVSLTISGPCATGLQADAENLVVRAARLLAQASDTAKGAALHLIKNLPVASGIGGGSADAAATLRLLNRMWGLHWPLEKLYPLAAELGADVPACLYGKACFAKGRGDSLIPCENALSGMPLLLVNPRLPISTAKIFSLWDKDDLGPLALVSDFVGLRAARNDLTKAAIEIAPVVAMILEVLQRHNPNGLNRMSGSGATCFAIFADQETCDAAHGAILRDHPGWWTLKSHVQ